MKEGNAAGSGDARRLRVYVRCTLLGEPARIVLDLKDRGIVSSVREAIVHGLIAFHERILDRDLQMAQVKASKRLNEEF